MGSGPAVDNPFLVLKFRVAMQSEQGLMAEAAAGEVPPEEAEKKS